MRISIPKRLVPSSILAFKLMIGAVDQYGGYVVRSTGDGIFALFCAPAAHDAHPQRAVHCAPSSQRDEPSPHVARTA